MTEAQFILGVIVAVVSWTVTVAGCIWWLSSQFTSTRHIMHGAISVSRAEVLEKVEDLEERVRALEMWSQRKNGV